KTPELEQTDKLPRLTVNQQTPREEIVITSISPERDVYCILVESIWSIPATAMEIKHTSSEDSVVRKIAKFVKTIWPSSSLKGDMLDYFTVVRYYLLSTPASCLVGEFSYELPSSEVFFHNFTLIVQKLIE
ncbi:unnamed protein product, partial [Hymenolepis diminuta]